MAFRKKSKLKLQFLKEPWSEGKCWDTGFTNVDSVNTELKCSWDDLQH